VKGRLEYQLRFQKAKLFQKEVKVKRKIFSICLGVVVLVTLIAVLVPGCTEDGGTQCTIEVKATRCDAPWEGDVQYTLTGPGAEAAPITGTNVTSSFTVDCGNWTCEYVSGGPPGTYLESITPPSPQEVTDGGTITFTLNFELDQDAWIECLNWTVDGDPDKVYCEMGECWVEVVPCQIIDVHFGQGVLGCPERLVAVNETSWLTIMQTEGDPGVQIWTVNDLCAVNKTAEPPAEPAEKVSQKTTWFGDFVDPGTLIPLEPLTLVELDVETIWQMVKETDYTKSINWFGISVFEPMPGHDCVLFELILPNPGVYTFQLVASANVELMDDEDVNPEDNYAECLPLTLTVWAI
jgi:hypothetical protein